jgi:hypothetical protein
MPIFTTSRFPCFFFAGTRDTLCDLALLERVLDRLKTPWHLEVVEGGDHSFKLPASFMATPEAVYEMILERTLRWMGQNSV